MRNEKEYLKAVAEYEKVSAMTNEEVIKEYNCDDDDAKEIILEEIQSEIDYYGNEDDDEDDDEDNNGLDPAFSSWAEVNRMFYSPL